MSEKRLPTKESRVEETVRFELPAGEAWAVVNELTYRAEENRLSRYSLAALIKMKGQLDTVSAQPRSEEAE